MSERLGIGILTYYAPDDLRAAVESIRQFTDCDYLPMVFDNSEDFRIAEWMPERNADWGYVKSPQNVGCAVSRNRISEWFIRRGIEQFVIMDQDVTIVKAGWLRDMLAMFNRYPDTGVVGWSLAIRQMGPSYKPDGTGAVPELPGMCNMYSAECVRKAGGWDQRMFCYRFDSLFCLKAGKAGLKTRIVWPDTDAVRHVHPHKGVERHPRMLAERSRSVGIFVSECKRLGLSTVLA